MRDLVDLPSDAILTGFWTREMGERLGMERILRDGIWEDGELKIVMQMRLSRERWGKAGWAGKL
jgi:hypothetical protein